ncbi:MAG: hypothetical protein ACRC0G_15270 [Fusobacteriaceae bacterium]
MRISNMDLSLMTLKESKKYFQLLLINKYEKFPFFTNMLINMADIEDVHEEQRNSALAYTYFDNHLERLKIRLNYKWIENGFVIDGDVVKLSNDNVLFLIYHELLHNFFHHFTRHKKYRKEYGKIANIVEDFYINEFLFRLFSGIKGFDEMPKQFKPIDYYELNEIALRNCGEKLPFSNYDEKPLESTLIDWFISFKKNWEKELNEENGSGTNGNVLGTGNHKVSDEYSERSLEALNEDRESNNKSKVSRGEADSISQKKIEEGANTAQEMSSSISKTELDCIRHKEKILKKDPFLNYVKITNTLKKMMVKSVYKNYTKPNRRKHSDSIVYKSKTKEDGLHIVVGVDVSGSVSDKELTQIYNMLGAFFDRNSKETSIDIFYWSSCRIKDKIHFHENIRDTKELLGLRIQSSGGTLLETAHEFLDEHYGKRKIQFLNITDGCFNFAKPPECVKDYYFCLTEKIAEEDIKSWYPKAKTRVCRIG